MNEKPVLKRYPDPFHHPQSDAHVQVAEANRRFYAATAAAYDSTERCVTDALERRRLRELLARAIALLPSDTTVLDACGGSGNASLALHELGVTPVTVDISPDMLAIYRRAAAERGVHADTVEADIVDFLQADDRMWQLIVFSSALHHLDDVEEVLRLAVSRLAEGGVIATIFDPRLLPLLPARLRRLDYMLHIVLTAPERVPRLALARLGRSVPTASALGKLAERHAFSGIDDERLVSLLSSLGMAVKLHRRDYRTGITFGVTRAVLRLLRQPCGFALVAQRVQ